MAIALTGKNLTTYIKSLIDLETDIGTQDLIIDNYEERVEELKPVCRKIEVDKPREPWLVPYLFYGPVLLFTVGMILFFAFTLYLIYLVIVDGYSFGMIFVGLFGVGLCAIVPGIRFKTYLYHKKCYKIEKEEYAEKAQEAARINAAREEKYISDKETWQETKNANTTYLQKNRKETAALLANLYAMDVIYPKYRNLPALTSIYEYLITGRCDSLRGPHGAYNLYEEEVRQNTVIAQLNEVIRNLEQIRQNQYMLYQKVCEINKNVKQVRNELNALTSISMSVAKLTAFNAFYNSCSAHHQQAALLVGLLK